MAYRASGAHVSNPRIQTAASHLLVVSRRCSSSGTCQSAAGGPDRLGRGCWLRAGGMGVLAPRRWAGPRRKGTSSGRFWDFRSESLRWRRDQRVESYQRLLEQFHVFHEAVRVVALLEPRTAESERAISEALITGIGFDNAMTAVWLYRSGRVVEAARLLDDELTKLWDIPQVQVLTPLEWIDARSTVQRSVENVTSLIRVEFGLPSLDVGLYPALHSPEAFRVPKR